MSWPARLALLVVLLLVGAGATSRVSLTTDLSAALPEEGGVAAAFADARRFSLLDTLLFDVDGGDGPPEALAAAVDAVGAALRDSGHFASVRWRYGLEDGLALRAAAGPSLAALTDPEELAARLSPEGMARALAVAQARLLGPAGAMTARTLPGDPLDLGGTFTTDLARVGVTAGASLREGLVVSPDGRHALIVARAHEPALGTTRESPLFVDVSRIVAEAPLPVTWVGPHRFAAEAAEQIHVEVKRAVTADLVLMVAVFLVAFRSVRPLAGTVPALLLAAVGAGAVAGLRSPMHALALAFGGAFAGLAVDYWIHLYLTAIRDGVPADFRGRLARGEAALRELLPAYGLSIGATLTAFVMLATSSYRAVADLGWIGVGTATGALCSVVLAGPLAFAALARPGDRVPRLPLPDPRRVALPLFLGFLALAVVALDVRFEGDPRAMDARQPDTAAAERAIQERYGGDATNGLLVATGPTLDAALEDLAAAQRVVEGLPGVSVRSPLSLLPPPSDRARVAELVADPAALEARFAAAAEAAGFDAPALLPGLRATLAALRAPTPATWEGTPGAELLARLVRTPEGEPAQVAAIVGGVTEEALRHAAHEVGLAEPPARLVLPAVVAEEGAEQVRAELLSRSGLGLLAVLAFMALRYRDPVRVLAASMPSLVAAAGTLGALAWLDIPLTPASGPAFVLVLGLAFDQGIFLVEADRVSTPALAASRAAIVIALATALAGFSGLLLATHPAVHSVGLVVSVGIVCAFVGAFGIVPAMLTPVGAQWTATLVRRTLFVAVVAVQLDALVGIAGWVTPPAPEPWSATLDRDAPLDRALGPNRLVRSQGLWVLRLEGSAYEVGRATAALAGRLPADNEAAMEAEFRAHVPNPLAQYLLVRGVPLLARAVAPHVPSPYLEELRGYVDGTPDPLGWIAPAFTRKLCYHAIHDVGQAMVDSPLLACTGFVAGRERTPDGRWLLARNFDFDGGRIFDEDKAVIYVAREGAIPFVHVGIVGLSGAVSGVNAEGIGVAVLAGASDAGIRPADPMIFVVREILEHARSLDDVRNILDARRGFVSEGILAVDGDAGDGAVFEVTSAEVTRLPFGEDPRFGSAIALSNHFRGERRVNDAANHLRRIEGTSVARLARMEELIAVDRGVIDHDRAVAILRDRAGVGDAPLPHRHEGAINADIASHGVVIDATARTLTVSTYPNLAGAFVRFSLDDLARGVLEGEVVAPPDDPARTFRARRARALVEGAEGAEPAAAEADLRRALALNPGDVDATLALGLLLNRLGRVDEARPLLQAVIDTPPERLDQLRAARAALGGPEAP